MFFPDTMDRRQQNKLRQDKLRSGDVAQDFSRLSLTPENFHAFYIKFINLRFPMTVAHLLELRYLINHTVDGYREPLLTPDYRQFRDSLQAAVDSFIDNPRHSERMLKILSLFRDIHYAHSIESRDAERNLREAMNSNRADHMKYIRYGLFFVFVGVSSGIIWLGMLEPSWLIKFLTMCYGYLSWYFFHKLPELDQALEKLTSELNEVLRRRVQSLNWKTLIHKLALVLGYKHIPGVQVFHDEHEHHHTDRSVYH